MDDSLRATVIVVAIVALGLPALLLLAARYFGPRRPNEIKNSVFESGLAPEVDARRRFSLKFHGIARVFLVFQGFLVLLLPLALGFRAVAGAGGWFTLLAFLMPPTAGLLFAIRQGVLRWE